MSYLGTSLPQNLAGFLGTCTMGNVQLDLSNSAAFKIPFPCSGGNASNGTAFTTNTCLNNVVPWQQYAEQYAVNNLGVHMEQYSHRVIIMPPNYLSIMTGRIMKSRQRGKEGLQPSTMLIHPFCPPSACAFSALASQGRWGYPTTASIAAGNSWGYGYVWIGGTVWNQLPVWAHEFGHTVSHI